MRANFRLYPKMWGLSAPDANIDHRRVPNLMKFFERRGKTPASRSRRATSWPGGCRAGCSNLTRGRNGHTPTSVQSAKRLANGGEMIVEDCAVHVEDLRVVDRPV